MTVAKFQNINANCPSTTQKIRAFSNRAQVGLVKVPIILSGRCTPNNRHLDTGEKIDDNTKIDKQIVEPGSQSNGQSINPSNARLLRRKFWNGQRRSTCDLCANSMIIHRRIQWSVDCRTTRWKLDCKSNDHVLSSMFPTTFSFFF